MLRRIYDISFSSLILMFIPVRIREVRLYRILQCIAEPLVLLHDEFKNYVSGANYELQHNGQVMSIEKVLNDKWNPGYDPTDHDNTKSIYISDGEKPDRPYLHLQAEDLPKYFDPPAPQQYLFSKAEYDAVYCDFIINVPVAISFDEEVMRAIVDAYKAAGKIYKIKVI